MSDVLLPLLIAVPIIAATLPLLGGLVREDAGWPIAAVTTLSVLGMALAVAREVFAGDRLVHALGGWQRPYGIELVADELSAAVTVLVALVAVLTLVFARVAGPRGNPFYAGYLLLTGGLLGLSLTGDLFNMFVFLEIVGLTTYGLIAADRSAASAYASLKYLFLGTVGASLYLIGVGYVFLATGSLNMIDLQGAIASVGYTDPLIRASYAFIVAGLALKIALFPVHSWQPDAYQRAPDAVTALVAALVSTTAAYALIRITYTVFTVEFLAANEAITTGLLLVASVSIVAGSALAAMQSDLKRMLAYSSVAQFGIVVAAVALANETALLGAIVHLIGHGLLKFGLFLAVGLLGLGYGARTVSDLASLAERAPFTAGAYAVLGLSLVGIPPSVGFLGKWYVALGAVEGAGGAGSAGPTGATGYVVVGAIFLSTLFTLAYVARLLEALYFAGAGEAGEPEPRPADRADRPETASTAADGGRERPLAPLSDAPRAPGVPDRVPPASLLVLVAVTLGVVALGFAGFAAAEAFEPFLGRVFA
ncbi:proton-conducting transporter transmembrane domain-containing protein [Haloparvum sedimenti]|uniref:proton-conducting transporter transmembrane domain-containing protein n=1 Tax=Haloparvum sedimenti TaxID=1678448 RepID=UPI00071E7A7D|nr:proton-conducting transporter membrane subunit [Haloparvum sedimenti]